MALTPSTMIELGTRAPDFALEDTEGRIVSRADFEGMPLLVMFICNHCPYVKHVAPALKEIAQAYASRGVGVVAIQSNDVEAYPADGPQEMKQEKMIRGYTFPYLYDATQEVAKAYTAACTPDIFLFDRDHKLYYRGQIDDTRPHRISSGNYDSQRTPATGADLRRALDALLAGEPAPQPQYPSTGCNIKWKPGNAPAYAGG